MDDAFSLRNMLLFSLIGLIVVIVCVFYDQIRTDDIFVMCDVGQGDGMYLRLDDIDILVDVGKDGRMSRCLGKYMSFYDRKIEMVFITNSDIDHYGGLSNLMTHYTISQIVLPPIADNDISYFRLINKLKKKGSIIRKVYAGDTISIGEMSRISILWPTQRVIEHEDKICQLDKNKWLSSGFIVTCSNINRYSQVFWLDTKNEIGKYISILFTGDITSEETNNYLIHELTKHNHNKKAFVLLKVPHHGSKNGLTQKLIESVAPDMAFISAGRRNRYGHPHKSITTMLDSHLIPYLVTSKENDIVYKFNQGKEQ